MSDYGISFNHVLFYGREYEEVLSMIALSEGELAGKKILDCPSGPDAFVAGASMRGFDIEGCDPLYAKTREEIVGQGQEDLTLALNESLETRGADGRGGCSGFPRKEASRAGGFRE